MAQGHVLLADDDQDMRELVTTLLERAGHRVTAVEDGAAALRRLYKEQPDLVILDVAMPEKDGWETLSAIRQLCDVPVMMLTASATELEKVRGLKQGADDYVTKPFGRQELVARVEALLRRTGARPEAPREAEPILDDGFIHIDLGRCEVRAGGNRVELTPLELKMLTAFVRNPNQVLSSDQLSSLVWDDAYAGSRDQVKVYVGYVRRKLSAAAGDAHIETVRGFGYRYGPTAA